jgi:DNA-binding GntR family transcriptional regulator
MQNSVHEGGARLLTPAQRLSLRRTTALTATQPSVAQRAQLVLDADTDVHAQNRTSRKWLRRYLEHGLDGLADAKRSGRPSAVTEEAAHRVLTEPLFIPSAKWTSRTIARAAGVSQSAVVRLWAHTFDPDALDGADRWARPTRAYRPTGLFLGSRCAVLVLAQGRSSRPTEAHHAGGAFSMRSPLRAPLQTILAAELLTVAACDNAVTSDFLEAATPDTDVDHVVVCRSPLADEVGSWVATRDRVELVVVPADRWQTLLPHLGAAIAPTALPVVEELAQHVRLWANRPTAAFRWPTPHSPRIESTRTTGSRSPVPPDWSSSQRMAESVAVAIRDGVHAGRLLGGERVTESFLMRATHASRSQVRDALRSLAADGLVDLEAGRGAIVPAPTVEDVLETYALRHSLGSLIVDSAVGWRPGTLGPFVRAVHDLEATARTGDPWATGEADLDVQDALAATVRLRRVPTMFRRMTMQVRLFTSLLGLKYTYSIDDIVTDDTALLDAVRRRDAARARRLWEQKMDAAARYMLRQLEHNT